jgi:hypothetical protein
VDTAPVNPRTDYVLPRKNMKIIDAAVFWPTTDDPVFRLVGVFPFPSSDHRLVWTDVRIPGTRSIHDDDAEDHEDDDN